MKNSPSNLLLATGALFLGTVIGSFGPFFTKTILQELPPMTVLFIRLTMMITILLPFVWSNVDNMVIHLKKLAILGIFLAGNLVFFVTGIQTATALSAGLLYALVPIFVLVINALTHVDRLTPSKLLSVFLGLCGAFIIIFSNNGVASFGSLYGTMLLSVAVVSYSFYLVSSKRLSVKLSPIELTFSSAFVTWVVSLLSMLVIDGMRGIAMISEVSIGGWISLLYIGIFLSVVMYFLVNWGVRHGSSLIAASMNYVGMVMTGLTGILLLGEHLTISFMIGAICIMVGLYLIALRPALSKKQRS